jgi:hypothetical protein
MWVCWWNISFWNRFVSSEFASQIFTDVLMISTNLHFLRIFVIFFLNNINNNNKQKGCYDYEIQHAKYFLKCFPYMINFVFDNEMRFIMDCYIFCIFLDIFVDWAIFFLLNTDGLLFYFFYAVSGFIIK